MEHCAFIKMLSCGTQATLLCKPTNVGPFSTGTLGGICHIACRLIRGQIHHITVT